MGIVKINDNVKLNLSRVNDNDIVELIPPFGGLGRFLMGSKGDLCYSTASYLLIFRNTRYDDFEKITSDILNQHRGFNEVSLRFRVIKANHERRFLVCDLISMMLKSYTMRRERNEVVVISENEKINVDGIEFTLSEYRNRHVTEHVEYLITYDNKSFRRSENIVKSDISESQKTYQTILFRVVDENGGLAKLMKSISNYDPKNVSTADLYYYTSDKVVNVKFFTSSKKYDIEIHQLLVTVPSDDVLLKCSTFYTIIIPRVILWTSLKNYNERWYFVADVYYNSKKESIVLNYMPYQVLFRCLRRKSISSYAKRKLPKGISHVRLMSYVDVDRIIEFNRFIYDVYEKIKNLSSKPKGSNEFDEFFEKFYVNVPLRKLNNVIKPWLEVFNAVKDLSKDSTLYIVTYGKGKERKPNFVGFRIDKYGRITLMPRRYVPISGIVMKGGDFEILYRDTYVKKLFEYQVVPKSEKARMLFEDIVRIRDLMRDKFSMDPYAVDLKLFTDKFVQMLDKYYDNDNLIMLAYKYLMEDKFKRVLGREKVDKVKNLLLGLTKTGSIDDILKNSEIFDVIRAVVKYEMKRRGYSMRKGVMFLGSPNDVKRRILEVVRGLRERVLALYEELGEEKLEVLKEVKVFSDLERVRAVLEF